MVGYQQQVVELTRCLCLLKEYAAEVDECYLDERGFPPHGKYVHVCIFTVVTSHDITCVLTCYCCDLYFCCGQVVCIFHLRPTLIITGG